LALMSTAEPYAAAADKSWAMKRGLEPEYLLTNGPYRLSRNPVYVGGTAIWGGWAILLGSALVVAGLGILTAVYRARRGVGGEGPRATLGGPVAACAKRTPRWLSAAVGADPYSGSS
jgi:protein-S-isoprenylcysteine O-methyltransferase Ste14